MRPIGAAVHYRAGTVSLRLVGLMVLGTMPAAFLGAYLLHLIGDAKTAEKHIEIALGAALSSAPARWCCALHSTAEAAARAA